MSGIDLAGIDPDFPDFSAPSKPVPKWTPVGADTLPRPGQVVVWKLRQYRWWYEKSLNADTEDQRYLLGSLKVVKGAFGSSVPVGISVMIPVPDAGDRVRFTEVEADLAAAESWMAL